jgi:hypothetical protein
MEMRGLFGHRRKRRVLSQAVDPLDERQKMTARLVMLDEDQRAPAKGRITGEPA